MPLRFQSKQILGFHILQRMKYVPFDLLVGAVKLPEHTLDSLPLGVAGSGASQIDSGPLHTPGVALDCVFIQQIEGTDDGHLSLKKILHWSHRTDGCSVQDVQEKGLDHIILVMAQGDAIAPYLRCRVEEELASR